MIYMRGTPVFCAPPTDLIIRMLDYVLHVLPALALLVADPGTYPRSALAACRAW
jgi:hypothetical protein